jgi:hypothetical protein
MAPQALAQFHEPLAFVSLSPAALRFVQEILARHPDSTNNQAFLFEPRPFQILAQLDDHPITLATRRATAAETSTTTASTTILSFNVKGPRTIRV